MRAVALALCLSLLPRAAAGEGADNDRYPIAAPAADRDAESIWWDGAYHMSLYQLGKLVDFDWWLWRVGKTLGIEKWCGAQNVDARGEVPDSAWFTNRITRTGRPPLEEMLREYFAPSPDLSGPLLVVSGKSGLTPGFVVEVARGDRYVLKLDPPAYPEMQSGAEIIGAGVLYAAGYHVPSYSIVHFRPQQLALSPLAVAQGRYKVKRAMRPDDLERILARAARRDDGSVRAGASLYVPGRPLGPGSYSGARRDDANDSVLHEYRRELRALRVVLAFINDTDARRGNTLDSFLAGPGGRGHLVHYQLDFSASLGSGNVEPKPARYGNEYVVDPPVVARSFLSAGLWVKPWEKRRRPAFAAAGSFESEIFDPERWKPSYANPAFERMTPADAFWGARTVTAFSDEDLAVIVRAARYSDPQAESYVLRTLIARRDKIGRAWLDSGRVNPLDRFEVGAGTAGARVAFQDLGLLRGGAPAESTRYRFQLGNVRLITADGAAVFPLSAFPPGRKRKLRIRTSRDAGRTWGRELALTLRRSGGEGGALQLLAIER